MVRNRGSPSSENPKCLSGSVGLARRKLPRLLRQLSSGPLGGQLDLRHRLAWGWGTAHDTDAGEQIGLPDTELRGVNSNAAKVYDGLDI